MSNTYTKGYSDGSALTEAMLDNAYQTLQLDIANTALTTTGSTSGQALLSNGSGIAASFQTIPDPQGPFALRNYGLKATAASGVLVVNLKTKALGAPSASDAIDFNYSTNGTTSASYSSVQVTAATTISLNASATLGYSATSTLRIFVYGYYNTVTTSVKLALSARSDFDNGGAVAMTAISASADSNTLLYATGALTVVPRLFGWIESTHNSGGSWQTPTKVNVTNISLGQRGVVVSSSDTGSFTTSSTSYVDVTNATLSITTTGRPVFVGLMSNAVGGAVAITTAGAGNSGGFKILRGTSTISITTIGVGTNTVTVPCGAVHHIDLVGAGTYTYKLQAVVSIGTATAAVGNCKLVAYEL